MILVGPIQLYKYLILIEETSTRSWTPRLHLPGRLKAPLQWPRRSLESSGICNQSHEFHSACFCSPTSGRQAGDYSGIYLFWQFSQPPTPREFMGVLPQRYIISLTCVVLRGCWFYFSLILGERPVGFADPFSKAPLPRGNQFIQNTGCSGEHWYLWRTRG